MTDLFLHRIGPLVPQEPNKPVFAQFYICDSSDELRARMDRNSEMNEQTMQKLQAMLHEVNPYVKVYETARERLGANASEQFHIVWHTDVGGINRRRYNAPQTSEVGAIVIGAGDKGMEERDIIVQPRRGRLRRISELSSCYDPMHYVLLLPHGTNGWSLALKGATRSTSERNKGVTVMQFYTYMLGVRRGVEPLWPYAWGRLCHQFIVDMFCRVESERLRYVWSHQRQIRAAVYRSTFSSSLVHANASPRRHS